MEIYTMQWLYELLSEKTLPSENSDSNLPGRVEDSNFGYYDVPESKPKSRALVIAAVAFVLVSAGFFSYYFMNQSQIDSEILDNTLPLTAEHLQGVYWSS